jgi:hypothetical protein
MPKHYQGRWIEEMGVIDSYEERDLTCDCVEQVN